MIVTKGDLREIGVSEEVTVVNVLRNRRAQGNYYREFPKNWSCPREGLTGGS